MKTRFTDLRQYQGKIAKIEEPTSLVGDEHFCSFNAEIGQICKS
ncbi:MAG: hypothetical protein UT65_C0015G0027 [Parcubacteria group bacterium GW2011_GWF2_39_8b]|nr:MAG: hypothetical protein UT65_C0015G0027 [Parcubacteria group bacterium GW2011_GWF2_39_8b]KKR46232.1 MAG: hypothetical protein UT81_C0001G0079 [Parcubacteria group bacterium GW2011_GWA2_40_14]